MMFSSFFQEKTKRGLSFRSPTFCFTVFVPPFWNSPSVIHPILVPHSQAPFSPPVARTRDRRCCSPGFFPQKNEGMNVEEHQIFWDNFIFYSFQKIIKLPTKMDFVQKIYMRNFVGGEGVDLPQYWESPRPRKKHGVLEAKDVFLSESC